MQLSVRDVAGLFDVSEQTVHRWVKEGALPAREIDGQYRFNRAELIEWATARRLDSKALSEAHPGLPTLAEALAAGGVLPIQDARDKVTVLRSLVMLAGPSEPSERELVLQMLLSREAQVSTGVGEGIAIPHARGPVVLPDGRARVSIAYLTPPVEFGAPDGKLVHTVFWLVSPTIRCHLHLLGRIAFALHDEAFKTSVLSHAAVAVLIDHAERIESEIERRKDGAR